MSDRHPTVDLPAMFEGPRVPTTYTPSDDGEYKPKHSRPIKRWMELRRMGKEQKAIAEGAEPYVGKHRRGQWPAETRK